MARKKLQIGDKVKFINTLKSKELCKSISASVEHIAENPIQTIQYLKVMYNIHVFTNSCLPFWYPVDCVELVEEEIEESEIESKDDDMKYVVTYPSTSSGSDINSIFRTKEEALEYANDKAMSSRGKYSVNVYESKKIKTLSLSVQEENFSGELEDLSKKLEEIMEEKEEDVLKFKIGDKVRVKDQKDIQDEKITPTMEPGRVYSIHFAESRCGLKGTITRIDQDNDCYVGFADYSCYLHPSWLIPLKDQT